MQKIYVYPFGNDMEEIVEAGHFIGQFADAKIIPLNNYVQAQESLNTANPQTDSLFFPQLPGPMDKADLYEKVLEAACRHELPIFMTKNVFDVYGKKWSSKNIKVLNPSLNVSRWGQAHKNIIKIDVPVISVVGIGPHCDKFLSQIHVRNILKSEGLNVSQIGTREYSQLFGIEPYPDFMFDSTIASEKRIKLFNQFAVELVEKEKSDVLVLGIPGGIMPLSPYEFKEFGEQAFLVNFAVPADYSILNLYFEEYSEKSIQTLLNICQFRFNMKVYCVNITNKIVFVPTDEKIEKSFSVSKEKIGEVLSTLSLKELLVLDLNTKKGKEDLHCNIMNVLSNPVYEG